MMALERQRVFGVGAVLVACVLVGGVVGSVCAEARPYIGIRLDTRPLPGLLEKHLQLDVGQGLRIQNVQKTSPAAKAGIGCDDIVIGCDGEVVHEIRGFIQQIRSKAIGETVSLELIHLGERRTVELELVSSEPFESALDDASSWLCPLAEPMMANRVFQMDPQLKQWQQMPQSRLPDEIEHYFDQHYQRVYETTGPNGSVRVEVTIDGDPYNSDSTISITHDNTEYTTTIGEIDELPESFRETAREALNDARMDRPTLDLEVPSMPGMRSGGQGGLPHSPAMSGHLQAELEAMQKRMMQMEEQMKRMMGGAMPEQP